MAERIPFGNMIQNQEGQPRLIYEEILNMFQNELGIPEEWLWVGVRFGRVTISVITSTGYELGETTITDPGFSQTLMETPIFFGSMSGMFMAPDVSMILRKTARQLERLVQNYHAAHNL